MILIKNELFLFLTNLFIYIFVLILPVMLYLKFIDKVNPLEYLKLNRNIKKSFIKGFIISFLYLSILIIKRMILGWQIINFNIGVFWINGLLVGILEEIPFRGFVIQKLMNNKNFIAANLLTTILFIIIHIPNWLLTGVNIMYSVISLIVVSIVLGYLFKETDSLWVPIICHSIFNLSIWIGL